MPRLLLTLFVCFLLEGCDQPPRAPPQPVVARPVDLAAVMRDVHFAWQPQGQRWVSAHSTYSAQVTRGGLDFTPYHWPGPTPAAAAQPGQAVRFGKAVVSRGARVLGAPACQAAQPPRTLTFDCGQVTEELENLESGIEQRWRVPRKPWGSGPLVVKVPVVAGRFEGRTQAGLHFAAGALSVRYGHGTWVDARGTRTEVAASFEHGAVVLRVPASVVESSVFPAVLDPVIGPEVSVDVAVKGPAGGSQQVPAVAAGNSNSLVVWSDQRAGRYDVYGARVQSNGTVLDGAGIPISITAGAESAFVPTVAWNGTSYLVAWNAYTGTQNQIFAVRVSSAGAVLDSPRITVAPASTGAQLYPSVASDGVNWLVAWEDSQSGTPDIAAARVSATGAVMDVPAIAVSALATDENAPAIAWSGSNYLVVWEDSRTGNSDIFGARLDSTGAVLDPAGVDISPNPTRQSAAAVSWTGSYFYVVWTDSRNGLNDVFGARVTTTGMLFDATGIRISNDASTQQNPTIACGTTECLVAWEDFRGAGVSAYCARVTDTGLILDSVGTPIATGGYRTDLSVAWDDVRYFVVWADLRGELSDNSIYGAHVSIAGAVIESTGIAVSLSANQQDAPAVAWGPSGALLAWHDFRAGASDIVGVRLSNAGAVLDATGIGISTAANYQGRPAIGWNGSTFLVAWEDTRNDLFHPDVYAARVTPAGAVLDPAGIAISTAGLDQSNVKVASNGVDFLAVWQDSRNGTGDVYAARVNAAGVVADPTGIAISTDGVAYESQPAASWNGSAYVVAWEINSDIQATRVNSAGAVLDAPPVLIQGGVDIEREPSVASDGTNSLVVWHALDSMGTKDDIAGARVTQTLGVIDTSGFVIASGGSFYHYKPAAALAGDAYFVTWADVGLASIQGARVNTDGSHGGEFAVSTGPFMKSNPALACQGSRCLVAWAGFDSASLLQTVRLRATVVDLDGGSLDAGAVSDAGTGDAGGVLDGGAPDGGGVLDGGAPDSGAPDGGAPDGGVLPDGGGALDGGGVGFSDGGALLDGGSQRARVYQVGCSCDLSPESASIFGLLALWAVRMRRRSGR